MAARRAQGLTRRRRLGYLSSFAMQHPLRIGLTLALGALGGLLAFWAQLPLAWMIGAMLAVTVLAVAGGPARVPPRLRSGMVAVLGVMLGSGFNPQMAQQIPLWSVSLASLLPYTALSGLVGYLYFRRCFGYDRATSYFSAMPGGLSEMILVGGQSGGDPRVISLTHAARILLVVMTLPFGFQIFLGYQPGAVSAGAHWSQVPLTDLALLGACAAIGLPLALRLRIPAGQLVGPLTLSAAVHLAGLTSHRPPVELVAAAQVVIGSAVGARFAGTDLRFLLRALLGAAGLSVILLVITLLSAWAVTLPTGLPLEPVILAYSPGGLAEMSLVALALNLDAAFVATHHSARIVIVVILAPLAFRLFSRWRRTGR